MKERAAFQERLQKVIRKNLIELFSREKDSRRNTAKECDISPSSITRWTASKNGAIPSSEYVYMIARHFGVTTDWIMTDHETFEAFDRVRTYAEAFLALKPLIDNGTISIESIQDPILRYLEEECQHITNHPSIDIRKKGAWIARVMELYNTPLPEIVEPQFWEYLRVDVPGIADTDRLVENANLARLVGSNRMEGLRYEYGKPDQP